MFPWILCCILLIVVFFLITKIIFIEKSIDEIHTEFQERLSEEHTQHNSSPQRQKTSLFLHRNALSLPEKRQ